MSLFWKESFRRLFAFKQSTLGSANCGLYLYYCLLVCFQIEGSFSFLEKKGEEDSVNYIVAIHGCSLHISIACVSV